jgi:hypothetical protein
MRILLGLLSDCKCKEEKKRQKKLLKTPTAYAQVIHFPEVFICGYFDVISFGKIQQKYYNTLIVKEKKQREKSMFLRVLCG